MNFMESVKETLGEEFNNSYTENGAIGYKTTQSELLDFNFKISSYRNKSEFEILEDFNKVWLENKDNAIKFLFFIRDREEGMGERRLFRVIFRNFAYSDPEMVMKLVPIVADYGRFDDLLELFDTPLEDFIIDYLGTKLHEDVLNFKAKKPISLLAKWLPSINASNVTTVARAKKIIKKGRIDEKSYRQMLSMLRKYIDVTERKMCANEWSEINYSGVPSRANLNYNGAFLRHDEERRRKFLEKVSKGETKINSSKVFPHDIVHKYTGGYSFIRNKSIDQTLEEMWKALPKKNISNTLVVADGSGSMTSHIGNTSVTCLDVANALAIYFAENNKGEFKDKYITFSENPQFVDFSGLTNLRDKILKAFNYDEVANTDIEKVFNLILTTAMKYKLSQDEMPKNILIISDMEFDNATNDYDYYGKSKKLTKKLFQTIEQTYKLQGYKMPKLIFWNIGSRTGTIPLKQNELGVALVSGFSTNIVEMIMNDKLDPLEILLDKLNTPRYAKILDLLK